MLEASLEIKLFFLKRLNLARKFNTIFPELFQMSYEEIHQLVIALQNRWDIFEKFLSENHIITQVLENSGMLVSAAVLSWPHRGNQQRTPNELIINCYDSSPTLFAYTLFIITLCRISKRTVPPLRSHTFQFILDQISYEIPSIFAFFVADRISPSHLWCTFFSPLNWLEPRLEVISSPLDYVFSKNSPHASGGRRFGRYGFHRRELKIDCSTLS